MDLVKDLIQAFEQAHINYMHIEMNDLKLELEKKTIVNDQVVEVKEVKEELPVITGTDIKSPIVGTFYEAPSPDSEPYVKEGQRVQKGETVCIVEAMKVMNEIKASCSGKVLRIFPKSGDFVEYNQTLMIIEEDDV